jgi:hypothetical protein
MHNFTSMYASATIVTADGDQATTRDDEGRDDALLDILETTTTAPSSVMFASTAEVTAAFYRHIRAVVNAAGDEDDMDREERESEIADDEN